MTPHTLALVGATGGAGTTRTAVELAAVGARAGHDVVVVDAAFATQGLSEYVSGRIGTDLTTLLTDEPDASLSAATYPIAVDDDAHDGLDGRADVVPTRAPFERVARAKTAEAARALERRIDEAAAAYDTVIVDTPPVASNQAVAVVTTVDRVAAVRPATPHGRDALARLHGRVADVGGSVDATIAVTRTDTTATDTGASPNAALDASIGPTDSSIAAAPTTATATGAYTGGVVDAYEALFDTALDLEFDRSGVFDRLTR
jgi:cellulose biosynthesis protein BcsQ